MLSKKNKNKSFQFFLGWMAVLPFASFAAESDFNAALRAANAGDSNALWQYQQSMQNDHLAYYPEYFLLNRNLENKSPETIIRFANQYPNTAMAEKLTSDYVEAKVKQTDFQSAAPVIQYISNPDQAESCAIAQVRAKTGDPLVFAQYKDVWLTTNSQPESCVNLAKMMLFSPLITQEDKEQRLWVKLRAGQSGEALATAQSLGLNLSLAKLNSIQANPLNYIWSAAKNDHNDYIYLVFAIGRLANENLDSALSAVSRAAQGTPPDIQKILYRTVGYIGGTSVVKNNFNREVLNSLDASYGLPFSNEEAEIYARQAIRFSHWEALIRAIDAMSVDQKNEDRWQYWLARAYEQQGTTQGKAAAQKIYQKLTSGDDYHNLLAQSRLGQSYNRFPTYYEPSSEALNRLAQNPHFNRAFTLKAIDAPASYVNREWNWAVRQAYLNQDDDLLLAAAKRAHDMAWYDRAIYAAERTTYKHNYTYRYAMPYKNYVVSHSQNAGIDPAWAYGLMRQESRFNLAARSQVGAGGLMQVMPETAKAVARQIGETYKPSALTDLNTNVRYGTVYLSMIHRQLNTNPVLATAGYNAGPNRAKRWQFETRNLDADQYTESIPILETRDYVKHVLTNATHYSVLLGQNNTNINKWMQPIPFREAN